MSTTPTPLPTTIVKDITWLKTHVLLLAIVGILVLASVYGIESLIARHDEANNAKAQADKAAILAITKQMQDQAAARDAELVQVINTQTATIQALQVQMNKRDQATKQQVTKDATLDAKSAAARLATQTQAASGEITVVGDDVTLDLPITRRVVAGLDTLATAQADLLDTQKQLAAETAIASKTKEDLDAQKAVVADKDKVIAASDRACQTQIDTIKSNDRKKLTKWVTIVGTVAFIIGRIVKPI